MKKLLFISVGFCVAMLTEAQSLNDLDRDPSFKGITIGAPISKYSHILNFSHVSKGKNVYRVYDSHYLSIFNVTMQEMIVVESNGKVNGIYLTKSMSPDGSGYNIFNPNILLSWFSNLKSRYGINNITLDNLTGDPSVCGQRWKTSKIVLDIVYLFYGTSSSERPKLLYSLYEREDDY